MIEMTFTATDVFDLKAQLCAFVGQFDHSQVRPDPLPTEVIRKGQSVAVAAQEAEKVAMVEEEAKEPGPVDMLKIKDQTVQILQAAMADGKIRQLRKLLMEHGNGAKSFPEVAPEDFPAIAAAVAAGALA